jgi:hypothetical protein
MILHLAKEFIVFLKFDHVQKNLIFEPVTDLQETKEKLTNQQLQH